MEVCPLCHERTDALWHALPVEPGYTVVYRLSHRRSDGRRCTAHRGEAIGEYQTGRDCVTINHVSRSDRADSRATA